MARPEVDWRLLFPRLVKYAKAALATASWEDAEDVAQRAILRLYDPESTPWDPAAEPDVFDHLARAVRHLARAKRREAWRRRKDLDEKEWESLSADVRRVDDELAERELAAPVVRRLRETLTRDEDLALLGCFEDGVYEAAEQSANTGIPIEEVRNARKRFFRRAATIQRELLEETEES